MRELTIQLPIGTSPTDALAYLYRALHRLKEAHQAERAAWPEKLSPEEIEKFKAWERKEWIPRNSAINLAIAAEMDLLESTHPIKQSLAELSLFKSQKVADSQWDKELDSEPTIKPPSSLEVKDAN